MAAEASAAGALDPLVPDVPEPAAAPLAASALVDGIQQDFETVGSDGALNGTWLHATPFVNVPLTTSCVGLRPNLSLIHI